MKLHIAIFVSLMLPAGVLNFSPSIGRAQEYSKDHFQQDGTYAPPHLRLNPDGIEYNIWNPTGNFSPYSGAYGTRVTRSGTVIYYQDTSAQRELEARHIHEEKLLQMQHKHESNMFDSVVKQKRIDEKNALGFLRRERAREAVQSSRVNARIGTNPFNSVNREESVNRTSGLIDNQAILNEQVRAKSAPSLPSPESLSFDGTKILLTLENFLFAYPEAKPNGTSTSERHVEYKVGKVGSKPGSVIYKFHGDRYLSVELSYTAEEVQERGGITVLMNQAQEELGVPLRESQTEALWLWPSLDRLVMAGQDGEKWSLIVSRPSLLSKDELEGLVGP